MLSALTTSSLNSVKARLTLFSGVIIAISALVVYLIVYNHLSRTLQDNVDQYLTAELNEFADIYADGGLEALNREVQVEQHAQGSSRIFIRVLDEAGRELIASDLSNWGAAAIWKPPLIPNAPFAYVTLSTAGEGVDARCIAGSAGPGVFVVMGITNEQHKILLQTFRGRFLEGSILLVAISLVGAWLIGLRAMRGVEMLTEAAEEIAGGALNRRITRTGYGYEIDRLAGVFNRMLDKIAALIAESKTLTDNIAHEMRSPLTRMRGAAETAATNSASSSDCRELAATLVEESDNLLSIVNSMLTISQIEAGLAKIATTPVDCEQLVHETCDLFAPLAEDRGITLKTRILSPVSVRGDGMRLRQVMANLLDNALKYTPKGGTVSVSLDRRNGHAVLSITDNGMGIAEKDLPHIFERFYRSDTSRPMPGTGLGLGLVHAIVAVHGGSISVTSAPQKGSTFEVSLPVI